MVICSDIFSWDFEILFKIEILDITVNISEVLAP